MSVESSVRDAFRLAIQAIPGFAGVSIKIRKRPWHSAEHGDSFPMVCLSPLPEIIANENFKGVDWIDFPIIVAIFQQLGATLESETQLNWQSSRREDLRLAFRRAKLADVTGSMDCFYEAQPQFDTGGLDQLYDLSLQKFTFRVSTPRNS